MIQLPVQLLLSPYNKSCYKTKYAVQIKAELHELKCACVSTMIRAPTHSAHRDGWYANEFMNYYLIKRTTACLIDDIGGFKHWEHALSDHVHNFPVETKRFLFLIVKGSLQSFWWVSASKAPSRECLRRPKLGVGEIHCYRISCPPDTQRFK